MYQRKHETSPSSYIIKLKAGARIELQGRDSLKDGGANLQPAPDTSEA